MENNYYKLMIDKEIEVIDNGNIVAFGICTNLWINDSDSDNKFWEYRIGDQKFLDDSFEIRLK